MLSDQAVQGLWAAKRLQPNRSLCGLLLKDLFNLNSAQYESVRKNFETRLSSSVSGIYEAKEVENKFAIVVQLPDTLAFDKGLMYASGATLAALAIGGATAYGLSGSRKTKVVSEVDPELESLRAENERLQRELEALAQEKRNSLGQVLVTNELSKHRVNTERVPEVPQINEECESKLKQLEQEKKLHDEQLCQERRRNQELNTKLNAYASDDEEKQPQSLMIKGDVIKLQDGTLTVSVYQPLIQEETNLEGPVAQLRLYPQDVFSPAQSLSTLCMNQPNLARAADSIFVCRHKIGRAHV